jgi:hypothetical protein
MPIGTTDIAQDFPSEVSFFDDVNNASDDVTKQSASAPDDAQDSEGAASQEPATVNAGVSSRGRQRTMSRAMRDSVSQRSFYGDSGMHYMQAMRAVTTEEAELWYAAEHDFHLGLQDRMRHPIAFHAEMMGDIMYFHQAMKQPDAKEFV